MLTRRVACPGYLAGAVANGHIVSASDFVAPVLPAVPAGWIEASDTPPGRFAGYADAAQGKLLWALSADLQRFGLDGSLSVAFSDLLGIAAARGDFHPPSAFVSIAALRRFLRHVGALPNDAVVLGLALPGDRVDAVVEADGGMTCLSRLPLCGDEPEPDGDVLGFDVYRPEGGELHPWLRESDREAVCAQARVSLNAHGLLADLASADRVAAALSDGGPGEWFPWRMTSYPLIDARAAARPPDTALSA